MSGELLVVAGEASGDRIAALVVAELARSGVLSAGIGGPASRAAGLTAIADAEALSAMGIVDVLGKAPSIARAIARLAKHVRASRPRAALLVNFTELNARLGRALRARGVRVLWCVAPQVWAWRPGRLETLRAAFDELAVILPFEEALWRAAGHLATYVGHPSWSAAEPSRGTQRPPQLAVLPGSRAGETARMAPVLVSAASALVASGAVGDARLLLAPGMNGDARTSLIRLAQRSGLAATDVDPATGAGPELSSFQASLCASGTAALEAALAGAAPVVAYRTDALTFALARRLVRTPHIALPNVLLGRHAYPELLQADVTVPRLVAGARRWLGAREEALEAAAELHALLAPKASGGSFAERVSALLLPWLVG